LKFSAIFLWHLVPWPSVNIQGKFYGNRPRGTPSPAPGELNTRESSQNIAILDLSKDRPISRKRCKIPDKFVLITNRNSHSYGLSIGTKIGDLE